MRVHMSVHARAYFSGPMDHIIYSPQKAICFIILLLKSTGVEESILETQKKKKKRRKRSPKICILERSVPGPNLWYKERPLRWMHPFPPVSCPREGRVGGVQVRLKCVSFKRAEKKHTSDKRRKSSYTAPSFEEKHPHPDCYTLYLQSSISRNSLWTPCCNPELGQSSGYNYNLLAKGWGWGWNSAFDGPWKDPACKTDWKTNP